MKKPDHQHPPERDRLLRIQRVIDVCIDRRVAGGDLSDDDIINANRDLMPELGEELVSLRLIEGARRRAAGSSDPDVVRALPSESARHPGPPDLFPGYVILGEAHRGGQGVVFRAIQESTNRKVAIKTTRQPASTDTRELARFEREVQILGALRHPNIVAIHDSGIAAGGSFYFVMDYIEGRPLDQYVQRQRQAERNAGRRGANFVRQTLEMFAGICDAVNAAHLRGIIHRDLKPGNILIDDHGQPHILDFGLAKLMTDAVDEDSGAPAMTMTGQFVGSLPWASPEQAQGLTTLDLRADVYSLGVVLFQALTERFPYDVTGNRGEVLDRIIQAVPAAPGSCNGAIDDEVETIILKCLGKEPERRYQTAGELSRDIRRYLAGEPIEAKRDSGWYVARKLLRRHRTATAVSAAFVLLITGSVISLAVMYRNQTIARKQAEQEATRANTMVALLQDMLGAADPSQVKGRDYTVRELLDEFSSSIPAELRDQPEIEARIRGTVGAAYAGLGEFDKAEMHLTASLGMRRRLHGEEHAQVAAAMLDLAALRHIRSEFDDAEEMCREALAMQRALFGDEHEEIADSLNRLASILQSKGEYDQSAALYEETLAMRKKLMGSAPPVAETLRDLAGLHHHTGDYEKAESLLREAMSMFDRHLGQDHPAVAHSLLELASLYRDMGRYDEAEPLFRRSLAMNQALLGDSHPTVAMTLVGLASLLRAQDSLDEAEELYRRALEIYQEVQGPKGATLAITMNNLANVLKDKGQLNESESLHRQAMFMRHELFGDSHPAVANSLGNLASVLKLAGKHDEGADLYLQAIEMNRAVYGPEHPRLAFALRGFGQLQRLRGLHDEAEALFREALAISRARLGGQHPMIGGTLIDLGATLIDLDRHHEAESALVEAAERSDDLRQEATPHLVRLYEARGELQKAQAWRESPAE